jgi:hypothetical protein
MGDGMMEEVIVKKEEVSKTEKSNNILHNFYILNRISAKT